MYTLVAAILLLFSQQPTKNNPNGIWESQSGSAYEIKLTGEDLVLSIVPGSSSTYLEYELLLKGQEDPNMYQGNGTFKALLGNGRECEFGTQWSIIVITNDRIMGVSTLITPDPETCDIVERGDAQVDLKRRGSE